MLRFARARNSRPRRAHGLRPRASRGVGIAPPIVLFVLWALACIGTGALSMGCTVEVEKIGVRCNADEPCEEGLTCIDGRCERARTMSVGDALPAGRENQPYRGEVPIMGGTPPYSVTTSDFDGPMGVVPSVQGTGIVISAGLPAGSYSIDVRVTDSSPVPETVSKTLTFDVLGLPVLDRVEAVPLPTNPPAGSATYPGNAITLDDGRWALSVLVRDPIETDVPTASVGVLIGDTSGPSEMIMVDNPDEIIVGPDPVTERPFGLPRVIEAGPDAFAMSYIVKEGDSSHALAVSRIPRGGGAQVHNRFELNTGFGYGHDLLIVDGTLYAAVVAVSISADIVVATFDANTLETGLRELGPFTGVREGEFSGLDMIEYEDEPWIFAASDLAASGFVPDPDTLEIGDARMEVEDTEMTHVRVQMVQDQLVHAWSNGLTSTEFEVFTASEGLPGVRRTLPPFTASTTGQRLDPFDMVIDGGEIVLVSMTNDMPAQPVVYLGSVDGNDFSTVDLTLTDVPGSSLDNPREVMAVVRQTDLSYSIFWSEMTDPMTGERRLYRALTREVVP